MDDSMSNSTQGPGDVIQQQSASTASMEPWKNNNVQDRILQINVKIHHKSLKSEQMQFLSFKIA